MAAKKVVTLATARIMGPVPIRIPLPEKLTEAQRNAGARVLYDLMLEWIEETNNARVKGYDKERDQIQENWRSIIDKIFEAVTAQ